ncbi:4Fe-4S dicluster domain-containing protein [Streptosporangium canum]|uniref:4Fe-4S dicluster domain-containing protein n=1 Tax=Streptosporangium canum TaxID=324952 RepID=UPI003423F1CC
MCVTGCPYKKVYFNHKTGKAEKCTFCYPRSPGRPPSDTHRAARGGCSFFRRPRSGRLFRTLRPSGLPEGSVVDFGSPSGSCGIVEYGGGDGAPGCVSQFIVSAGCLPLFLGVACSSQRRRERDDLVAEFDWWRFSVRASP